MTQISGKVVAITGATGRLGRLAVQTFEQHGAHVAALVRNAAEARLIPVVPGGTVRAYPCDVTDEESVRATFDAIGDAFGRLDALVHTVGTWGSRPFLETVPDEWEQLLRLNLTSTMLCFREAARLMATGDGGHLIGIASGQGADRGVAQQAAYSAAKAGVVRLVESVDAELSPTGICATAIAPSTLLFEPDATGPGVQASSVTDLMVRIVSNSGGPYGGQVIRMYGP